MITLMETFSILEPLLPMDIITNHIIPYTYEYQPAELLEDVREFHFVHTKLCMLYQQCIRSSSAIRSQIKIYCGYNNMVSYNELCFRSFSCGKTNIARFLRIFLARLSVKFRKQFLLWQCLRLE